MTLRTAFSAAALALLQTTSNAQVQTTEALTPVPISPARERSDAGGCNFSGIGLSTLSSTGGPGAFIVPEWRCAQFGTNDRNIALDLSAAGGVSIGVGRSGPTGYRSVLQPEVAATAAVVASWNDLKLSLGVAGAAAKVDSAMYSTNTLSGTLLSSKIVYSLNSDNKVFFGANVPLGGRLPRTMGVGVEATLFKWPSGAKTQLTAAIGRGEGVVAPSPYEMRPGRYLTIPPFTVQTKSTGLILTQSYPVIPTRSDGRGMDVFFGVGWAQTTATQKNTGAQIARVGAPFPVIGVSGKFYPDQVFTAVHRWFGGQSAPSP